ncbi:uncharacterized protein LOC118150265 isoform X2 [Callithrix jacchus]|uniref:uncharacterized protein LOC118150265 isoform X2 n=1 Tax=Callithrix jacchus TaxID=9483 RepID=UPI0023DD2476|nr:uncharacterized protein LOC118150265 isoform X2 [Callithrix jacchus]
MRWARSLRGQVRGSGWRIRGGWPGKGTASEQAGPAPWAVLSSGKQGAGAGGWGGASGCGWGCGGRRRRLRDEEGGSEGCGRPRAAQFLALRLPLQLRRPDCVTAERVAEVGPVLQPRKVVALTPQTQGSPLHQSTMSSSFRWDPRGQRKDIDRSQAQDQVTKSAFFCRGQKALEAQNS